ncbi:dynein light chain Tctex-type 5-like [Gigantopelta aegis]|uniref:dynein light chain Tctex-type 5-like n=1 Tax=Gigantopelta aegis TaxID=1735272 RepID=UPI001B88A3C6|nr:dynein light chain Tctex-type 5-like [Gigantopelta aegis]
MHAYRPRAGTVGSRKDTFFSTGSKDKHFQAKDQDRQSQGTDDHNPVEYENTYKMEPDLKFQESQVRDIIAAVLKENISEKEYNHSTMNRGITLMCSKILERVKQLDMKRYKLISHVLIGENNSTTLQFSSRCLWDVRWDTFTSVTVTSGNIYATGMVFGVYAE